MSSQEEGSVNSAESIEVEMPVTATKSEEVPHVAITGQVIDDEELGEPIAPIVQAEVPPSASVSTETVETPPAAEAVSPNSLDSVESPIKSKENAILTEEVFLPRTRGSVDETSIPPARGKEAIERISSIPNVRNNSEAYTAWAGSLSDGGDCLMKDDFFGRSVDDEKREFRQYAMHSGKRLGPVNLRSEIAPGTRVVDGEKAAIQLMSHLGFGGLPRIPLWKSGFWVAFKPMLGVEFVDLWYTLQQDEVTLGRWSYGLALSGTVCYTLDRILEAAIRHVYNTSVISSEMPLSSIREYLCPQDINQFILGFLTACYPSGHYYNTACVNNPTKCNHVFEGTLNLAKIGWSDTSNLSQAELDFMANPSPNNRTLQQVKDYQERVRARDERRVTLFEGTDHEVALTLHTPTTVQYLNESFKWINGIVDAVSKAPALAKTEKERQKYINDRADASELMEYVHWVKSIEYGRLTPKDDQIDGVATNIILDRETIATNLSSLSPVASIREQIVEEIKKFIEDTTVTVIAVPAYSCPVCDTPQEEPLEKEKGRKVSLVPIDLLQVFVSLLTQRLSRIGE